MIIMTKIGKKKGSVPLNKENVLNAEIKAMLQIVFTIPTRH